MKYIVSVLIMMYSLSGFSQLTDSLVPGKGEMLSKFFDANYGRLSPVNNYLEPEIFLAKLDSFKNYAYTRANIKENGLRKKDIDAFSRLTLIQYLNNYGVDTIKENEFYSLLREGKDDSVHNQKIEEASNARFTKKLPQDKQKEMEAMVYTGWEINDSHLFKSSNAFRQLVDFRINMAIDKKFEADPAASQTREIVQQKMVNELVKDKFIHDHYSYEIIDHLLKTGDDVGLIDSMYKQFRKSAGNTLQARKMDTVYKNYKTYARNAPAPDFNYYDIDGKQVSLKSLRGKYVYIDVWATWCGPCKMEIPYLKKLEEEYGTKNIHFVSLSVDKPADKGLWEKYVRSNNLKGIQLIVGNNSKSSADFTQKFNISYIPRFILIGPDGRIVDPNAPRPSHKEIRELFDSLKL